MFTLEQVLIDQSVALIRLTTQSGDIVGHLACEPNIVNGTGRRVRRSRWGGLVAIFALVLGSSAASSPVWAQRALPTPSGSALRPPALAFTGVTVIDVTDGRLLPEQTVVVIGQRVHAVGPVKKVRVPPDAQVVDARGKYLIPGLWDMHTHVDQNVAWYPDFIAYGVTGMREMGQRYPNWRTGIDSFRVWQRQVVAGTRVGPRAIGPSLDLNEGPSLKNVPHVFDSLKAAGLAFLKYHGGYPDREYFFTVAREARRVGLPLVGHVTDQVSEVEAADSGLRNIEHVWESRHCWAALAALEDSLATTSVAKPADSVVAERSCALTAAAYLRNDTWLTPTLPVYYHWTIFGREGPWTLVYHNWRVAIVQRFIRTMRRFGVRTFLAGTDMGGQRNPGISLLQDVILLAHTGLTPLEALQAATLNPAIFLNATDSLGTVAPGKLADLVLLDANPLTDIYNVMSTRAVVANGRYFDRATLDTLAQRNMEWRDKQWHRQTLQELAKDFTERMHAAPPKIAKLLNTPAQATRGGT